MQVSVSSFLLLSCIYSLIFYFFALRWASINRIFSITISVLTLFKHHLIAFFFSNGLPSTVGGDLWRMKELYSFADTKSKAVLIPIVERLSGFFAVYILGIIGFFAYAESLQIELYQLVLVTALAILVAFFVLSIRFTQLLAKFASRVKNAKAQSLTTELVDIFSLVSKNKQAFVIGIVHSVIAQLIYACCVYFMIRSIGETIAFVDALLIVPIVYFVSVLPVSIGGFGLREGTFIVLLPQFGVHEEKVVAVSFLLTLMQLFVSLSGGILFLLHKKKVERD